MKKTFACFLFGACLLSAQEQHIMIDRLPTPAFGVTGAQMAVPAMGGNIKNAPYSAEVVTENTQTLADGNKIVQSTKGFVARDSMGRTRNETTIPAIANMTAANPPRIVFINDPVAETSWSLNLTDKTANKTLVHAFQYSNAGKAGMMEQKITAERGVMAYSTAGVATAGFEAKFDMMVDPLSTKMRAEKAEMKAESIGSKVIEGVVAEGKRSTHTIPAGEVGNEKPIEIVNESWFSTELKTMVYSRRYDPRMGEQIYKLTNIQRAEPDPSLFTVPADFKVADPADMKRNTIMFRTRDE